jgi:hypothetical protein
VPQFEVSNPVSGAIALRPCSTPSAKDCCSVPKGETMPIPDTPTARDTARTLT